jgi:hypothetical protein
LPKGFITLALTCRENIRLALIVAGENAENIHQKCNTFTNVNRERILQTLMESADQARVSTLRPRWDGLL